MRWVRGLFKPVEVVLLFLRELVLKCTVLREVVRIGVYVFHQVEGYQIVLFFPYESFGRICNLHLVHLKGTESGCNVHKELE